MGDTPIYWKCAKCRLTTTRSSLASGRTIWIAKTGSPTPTGRVRSPNSYRPGIEYRCDICAHIGWSRHPAAVKAARMRGFCPEYNPKEPPR